jgi:hypothetical protein
LDKLEQLVLQILSQTGAPQERGTPATDEEVEAIDRLQGLVETLAPIEEESASEHPKPPIYTTLQALQKYNDAKAITTGVCVYLGREPTMDEPLDLKMIALASPRAVWRAFWGAEASSDVWHRVALGVAMRSAHRVVFNSPDLQALRSTIARCADGDLAGVLTLAREAEIVALGHEDHMAIKPRSGVRGASAAWVVACLARGAFADPFALHAACFMARQAYERTEDREAEIRAQVQDLSALLLESNP